jgi:hypothetical protein
MTRAQRQSCHRKFLCDRNISRLCSDDPIGATKPLNNPSTPHRPPPNADDYGAARHAISTDTRAGLGCVKATSLHPEGRGRHPVCWWGWAKPRAVDAGERGLGRPARHNASATTGAARGYPDQHHRRPTSDPGARGRRNGAGEWVGYSDLRRIFSTCHLESGSSPGLDPVSRFSGDGLLARSASWALIAGLLTVRQSWQPGRQALSCRSTPRS